MSGWKGSGFRSGDGAVIHLEEVRGGCLFYAARFRFVLTHSHLRQRLLGRNLITLFSTVNTPGEIFFRRRRRRSPRTPPPDERADAAASADARRRRTALRTKAHKTSGFLRTRFATRSPRERRAWPARRRERLRRSRPGDETGSGGDALFRRRTNRFAQELRKIPDRRRRRRSASGATFEASEERFRKRPDAARERLRSRPAATRTADRTTRTDAADPSARNLRRWPAPPPPGTLSGRRPRAARRSRRDRAVRSAGPARWPRPRTASLRRRRPR